MKIAFLLLASVATAAPALVSTDAKCAAYLCKYGYVLPLNCVCPDTAEDRASPGAERAAARQRCRAKQFAAALTTFQHAYGLSATGECDLATMRSMATPRCGVADNFSTLGSLAKLGPAADGAGNDESGTTVDAAPLDSGDGGREPWTDSGSLLTRSAAAAAADAQASRLVASYACPLEAAGRPPVAVVATGSGTRQVLETAKFLRNPKDGEEAASPPPPVAASRHRLLMSLPTTSGRTKSAAAFGSRAKRSHTIAAAVVASAWVNRTKPIRWRVVRYTSKLSIADTDSAIEQAFRKWAAVTPLCFVKDSSSDVRAIDVAIAFLEGQHSGDYRNFDGYGGEIAHSSPTQFTHFDAAEPWTVGSPGSSTGYYLLPVAMHEFGHLIGLSHSLDEASVMHSLYSDRRSLSDEDVAAAAAIYGQCGGRFDAATDVLLTEDELDELGNIIQKRYFSTIFFRNAVNWLYKNSIGRPMDGEPMAIASSLADLPNALDAVVQHSKLLSNYTHVDTLLAFKGSQVYVCDYRSRRVLRTAAISSFFPSGSARQPLPNNLDSGYFDPRDGNIYFFKDDMVYVYRFDPVGPHSCCESIRPVIDVYPPARDEATAAAAGGRDAAPYRRNVDVAYLSLSQMTLYLFKDERVWATTDVSVGAPLVNSMSYRGLWNQLWKHVCEADC